MRPKFRPSPVTQQWLDSLMNQTEVIRASLKDVSPPVLADRSGTTWNPDENELELDYNFQRYRVTLPDIVAYPLGSDEPAPKFVQAVIATYLKHADGTRRSGKWLAFRDLPDGRFYHQVYQGFSGDRLAKELSGLDEFITASETLAEVRLPAYGDAAFSFRIMPRIYLAAIYWEGDEEFPPRASILFDEAASHYMPIYGLALLGSGLADILIRKARER